MGVVYIDYPKPLGAINVFRRILIGAETVVWSHVGAITRYRAAALVAVRRNPSFGASFEANRYPHGE